MIQALYYSLKVWVTSALVTPIILMLILLIINIGSSPANSHGILYSSLYLTILLLLGSFLPWVVAFIFSKRIINSRLSPFAVKLTIYTIFVLLFASILLIGYSASHTSSKPVFVGFLGFAITTGFCSWFYNLKPLSLNEKSKGV